MKLTISLAEIYGDNKPPALYGEIIQDVKEFLIDQFPAYSLEDLIDQETLPKFKLDTSKTDTLGLPFGRPISVTYKLVTVKKGLTK